MTDYTHITSVEQMQFDLFSNTTEKLKDKKCPVMLELGSAEALYSKRFYEILNSNCLNICVELRNSFLEHARRNLPSATFFHGYVGTRMHIQEGPPSAADIEGAQAVSLISLFDIPSDGKIDIVHMDIQGSEVSVLQEMLDNNLFQRVEYLFCSIHDNTYSECKKILNSCGCAITYIWDDSTQGGYGDGLIVCKFNNHEK
jgi:hypothetical protein